MHNQASFNRRTVLAGGAASLLPWARASAQGTSSITVATVGDPGSLDPMPYTADLVSEIDQHIHETLYIFDPALHFFPVLATALPDISPDGKRYTIPLRTDARFHDGSMMIADDVVTSLQRWMRLSPRGKTGRRLRGQRHGQQSDDRGDDAEAALCADAGAARLSQWRRSDHAEAACHGAGSAEGLRRHRPVQADRIQARSVHPRRRSSLTISSPPGAPDGYAGKRQALIDELRFVPVPNPVTRVDGLLSGQFHFADLLTPEGYARLANQANVKQGLVDSPNNCHMIFNTKAGVLSDARLRRAHPLCDRAIRHADRCIRCAAAVASGRLDLSEGNRVVRSRNAGYNVHDPDKAKALMKEAGYDGKPIRFLVTTQYDYMFKIGQVAQAQLADVGFKVDVQVMDWATLLQKRTDPSLWEGFIASHSLVADPTLITIVNPSYPGWWDSPDKRAAMDAFVTESDQTKRMASWKQLQAIFYRDVPTIKLGEFLQLYGISTKLTGYTPLAWPCFWNVGLSA